MSRLLSALVVTAVLTAVVATTVASGALDAAPVVRATADPTAGTTVAVPESTATEVQDGEVRDGTGATSLDTGEAGPLGSGSATGSVPPRIVAPDRDRYLAAAPVPDTDSPGPDGPAPDTRSLSGTGTLLAAVGATRDPVEQGGRTVRFSVEVEEATGLDPDVVAAEVEAALYDQRSWARDFELRRVAPRDASVHVVVATPASTDRLCTRAGLDTNGWLSCWNGRVAAINLDRWEVGIGHVEDLRQYRRYVVNHEVGHGLGFDHVDCPGRGRLAPLMQQQTKSLDGCRPNEWAHPDGH